jgi:predicted TIM-barrel fold metal-dependent hydrolase
MPVRHCNVVVLSRIPDYEYSITFTLLCTFPLFQVGQVGVSGPMEPCRPIPYVDEIALHFPDLTIIACHIGVPWTNEMIALAEKHRHVYIETSGYLPNYYPKELLAFMDSRGSDKVMFGTNFPMLSFDKCVQQASELKLKPQNMEKFLWGNANRVFKLGLAEKN